MTSYSLFKDLLRWHSVPLNQWLKSLIGAFSMGFPLWIAMQTDHLAWGFITAIGCLLMSDAEFQHQPFKQIKILLFVFSSIVGATVLCGFLYLASASPIVREGGLILAIFTIALIGHHSLPLALWSTRLSIYAIIMSSMLLSEQGEFSAVFFVLLGAWWSGVVMFIASIGLFIQYKKTSKNHHEMQTSQPLPNKFTHIQHLERWYRALSVSHTWMYPTRLVLCLLCTWALQYIWPSHHFQWSALTVGIILQRNPEGSSVKALQRGLGTILGVLAASIFLYIQPHHYALLFCIVVLAGLRVFLKPGNYLFYTMSVTPLMMLILSSQEDLYSPSILWDRLVATLVAIVLVFSANYCIRSK